MRGVTLVAAALCLIAFSVFFGQQLRAASANRLPSEARARLRQSMILVAFSLMLFAAAIFI
jgi:hypothetical protein